MNRGIGLVVLFICGIAAAGFALYGYFTPLTGITGTAGPLLAAFGGAALVVAAVLLRLMEPGALRAILMLLTLLAALGVAAAGHFLLSTGILVAGLAALCGFAIALFASETPETAA
jgi:hypothetical protein